MKALICALFTSVSLASAMLEPDRDQHILDLLERGDRQVPVVPFEETLERYGCHGHFDANSRNHTKDSLLMLDVEANVEEIPEYLCSCCESLNAIRFKGEPLSLQRINNSAFGCCIQLQSISIPSTVKYIGEYAFDDCTSLIGVELFNAALEELGRGAFRGCVSLQSVCIPTNLKKIGPCCFQGCMFLSMIKFADGSQLQEICSRAFDGCSPKYPIYIPNKVHTIGSLCFNDNSYRMQVFISEDSKLQRIGVNVFPYHADVNIPAHVAHRIGMRTIDQVQADNPAFQRKASENVVDAALLQLAFPNLFPNPILTLSNMYFSSFCKSIETLIIPHYVTVIAAQCFAGFGLSKISFEEPAHVQRLGRRAFQLNNIKKITIPASVQEIHEECFFECYDLKNVYIAQGSQLQHIGDKAFMTEAIYINTTVNIPEYLCEHICGILEQRYPSFNIEEQLAIYP